jgi:hypothetical protein
MKYEGGYRQAIEDSLVETSATVFSLYHIAEGRRQRAEGRR